MAAGLQIARGNITTNTDTAVVTPSTVVPSGGERVYIYWITITVKTAGTASRVRVENGVGGSVLARMSTVTADALLNLNYTTGDMKNWKANALSAAAVLNINTSGTGAADIDYEVGYEVRG